MRSIRRLVLVAVVLGASVGAEARVPAGDQTALGDKCRKLQDRYDELSHHHVPGSAAELLAIRDAWERDCRATFGRLGLIFILDADTEFSFSAQEYDGTDPAEVEDKIETFVMTCSDVAWEIEACHLVETDAVIRDTVCDSAECDATVKQRCLELEEVWAGECEAVCSDPDRGC